MRMSLQTKYVMRDIPEEINPPFQLHLFSKLHDQVGQ